MLEQNIYVPFATETCRLGGWQEVKPGCQEIQLPPVSAEKQPRDTRCMGMLANFSRDYGLEGKFQIIFLNILAFQI